MFIEKYFGTTSDGKEISVFTNKNKNGMEISIINFGGAVTSLKVPDKDGKIRDIVLGYDDIESYENQTAYLGVIIGRNGNRIGDAKFSINGVEYILTKNEGENQLHGGIKGFDKKVWEATICKETLKLSYSSPDMEEGYPGNLEATVEYTLTDENEVFIEYTAVSDKDTVVNLTNHSYFNLNGDASGSIENHLLKLNAEYITPVNSSLIPDGKLMKVEGTPFDFRDFHTIGERVDCDNEQLSYGKGYDHNYFFNEDGLKIAAEVIGDESKIKMSVYTDSDAVQLYTGNAMKEIHGKNNALYEKRGAFCLETQSCPNAINCPELPTTLLNKGEEYYSVTFLRFEIDK